nr:MAG TPA: hypothetical protein [Caudoviricetes sp.]
MLTFYGGVNMTRLEKIMIAIIVLQILQILMSLSRFLR